jgi:hypothetical protein
MSRDLPPPLASDIEQPVVRPFIAIRIELPDPVYVWTGIGTLTFDDADGNSRNGSAPAASARSTGSASRPTARRPGSRCR